MIAQFNLQLVQSVTHIYIYIYISYKKKKKKKKKKTKMKKNEKKKKKKFYVIWAISHLNTLTNRKRKKKTQKLFMGYCI